MFYFFQSFDTITQQNKYEALTMILCYVVYCVALHFNTPLEKWAYSLNLPIKLPTKEEQSALVTFKNVPEITYSQGGGTAEPEQLSPVQQQQQQQPQQPEQNYQAYNENNE